MKQSVSVLLACKEIQLYLVKRWVVSLTTIVLLGRNVTILQVVVVGENVCPYVEVTLAPKGHHVLLKITKKSVLAILH